MIEIKKEKDLKQFNYDTFDLFGHYAKIEMEFYGSKGNEKHLFKIINSGMESNFYYDVPFNSVTRPAYIHQERVKVASVIHCGIKETDIYLVPLRDIEVIPNSYEIELQKYKDEVSKLQTEITNIKKYNLKEKKL